LGDYLYNTDFTVKNRYDSDLEQKNGMNLYVLLATVFLTILVLVIKKINVQK